MDRSSDWPERLAAFIAESSSRVFSWGEFDCCLFVCDALLAMTGTDPGEKMRGKYSSRGEADELLMNETGKKRFDPAIAALAGKFGLRPKPVKLAGRGDVVIVRDEARRKALAIVDLDGRFAVGMGERGLVRLPMSNALKAWGV